MTYRRTDINSLNPIALCLLLLMRHRVRNHQLPQFAAVQFLDRIAAQNPVRHDRDGFSGAVLHDNVRGLDKCTAGIGHVVYDNSDPSCHIADKDHAGDFVRSSALFMDQSKAEVKAVCYRCRPVANASAYRAFPLKCLQC